MKLTIECDRTIKSINITFDDSEVDDIQYSGNSGVKQVKTQSKKTQKPKANEENINFGDYTSTPVSSGEPVKAPDIPDIDITKRPPKIAEEIQNASF